MGLPRWWSDGVPLLGVCAAGLVGGGLAHLLGAAAAGNLVWAVTTATAVVPATWWVVQSLRRRQPGVDMIAVLALVGTLLVGEYLAGAVIAVMLASGRALEARASARATRDLHALLARSPRVVHRYVDGQLDHPGIGRRGPPVTCCWSPRARSCGGRPGRVRNRGARRVRAHRGIAAGGPPAGRRGP